MYCSGYSGLFDHQSLSQIVTVSGGIGGTGRIWYAGTLSVMSSIAVAAGQRTGKDYKRRAYDGHQHTLDVPVTETTGILPFTERKLRKRAACIRCARCVSVCPIHLLPLNISAQSLLSNYEEAERLHAMDCIECGCCSYICPASRPLLQSIKVAKKEITKARKQNAQAKQATESIKR